MNTFTIRHWGQAPALEQVKLAMEHTLFSVE